MMVEMRKLILVIVLIGIVLLGLSDVTADTSTPNNEVTGNSSAGATITITIYTVADE